MDFTFYTAGEIIFGNGKISSVGEIAARFGSKAMICTRGTSMEKYGALEKVRASLAVRKINSFVFNLPAHEPTVSEIDRGAEKARSEKPDVVIGLGGGSTIDTAKAVSGLATNPGSVADYLEGVGRGWTITAPSLPYIAIPTTAGTGSEVTKNAVISSDNNAFKKSIRSPHLIPNIALLDPELTLSVPTHITAETGMDALTQLIESYVSAKAQPIPQALAIYGIRLAGKYLHRAVQHGSDIEAREGMLLASLLSGLALANSGLGAAHGIAAALGALAGIPHGKACAILIPHVMRVNLPHCIEGFATIAGALDDNVEGTTDEKANRAVEIVSSLRESVGIPRKLSAEEIDPKLIPELVRNSRGSSMRGNPVKLCDEEIESIIRTVISN